MCRINECLSRPVTVYDGSMIGAQSMMSQLFCIKKCEQLNYTNVSGSMKNDNTHILETSTNIHIATVAKRTVISSGLPPTNNNIQILLTLYTLVNSYIQVHTYGIYAIGKSTFGKWRDKRFVE